jgi:polygalacturonase
VIRTVTVDSIGPNNDGFDPDACDMVLCDSVVFNTGDDCIAIKSGKNLDNEYGPAQNHVIQNCTMNSGHGGITLGSEMGGGVQKIYARNLAMLNQFWATNSLNIAIRIKTNMNRGGFVKDFYVDNVTAAACSRAVRSTPACRSASQRRLRRIRRRRRAASSRSIATTSLPRTRSARVPRSCRTSTFRM